MSGRSSDDQSQVACAVQATETEVEQRFAEMKEPYSDQDLQQELSQRGITVDELKQVVKLAREGKLKAIPVEKRPLSEVSRTLDELKAGKIIGRVVAEIG